MLLAFNPGAHNKSLVIHLPREATVKSKGNKCLKNTDDGPAAHAVRC